MAWTRSGGTCSFTCDPVSWLASDNGISASVAIVHADLFASDTPLVGYCDFTIELGNLLMALLDDDGQLVPLMIDPLVAFSKPIQFMHALGQYSEPPPYVLQAAVMQDNKKAVRRQ